MYNFSLFKVYSPTLFNSFQVLYNEQVLHMEKQLFTVCFLPHFFVTGRYCLLNFMNKIVHGKQWSHVDPSKNVSLKRRAPVSKWIFDCVQRTNGYGLCTENIQYMFSLLYLGICNLNDFNSQQYLLHILKIIFKNEFSTLIYSTKIRQPGSTVSTSRTILGKVPKSLGGSVFHLYSGGYWGTNNPHKVIGHLSETLEQFGTLLGINPSWNNWGQ